MFFKGVIDLGRRCAQGILLSGGTRSGRQDWDVCLLWKYSGMPPMTSHVYVASARDMCAQTRILRRLFSTPGRRNDHRFLRRSLKSHLLAVLCSKVGRGAAEYATHLILKI